MKKEQIFGVIRHALTFIGGVLVAKGIIDEGTATELTGGVISFVGLVWSFYEKVK